MAELNEEKLNATWQFYSSARACEESGGQGRNRTVDTRIFSPVLYRLSYLPDFEKKVNCSRKARSL